MVNILKVEMFLKAHNSLRTQSCINMIASENIMSPAAFSALSNDIAGRYHAEWYGPGSKYIQELFVLVKELACRLFRAENTNISPISGNMADLAVLYAFTKPGDCVAAIPFIHGGYPLNYEFLQREFIPLAYSDSQKTLDPEKSLEILEKKKPSLVILGASFIPFPHPIKQIANFVHDYGGILVYDASHPLGLIAGGEFQDPLREGADILIGSTHKSFPGPQGGIILSGKEFSDALEVVIGEDPIKKIVLVDNLHNARIAALGITLEEMIQSGSEYAKQIIKNSQAFAKALSDNNLPCLTRSDGLASESHQIFLKIPDFNVGREKRDQLAKYRIFTDAALRFGTAELTRRGYREQDMQELAQIIFKILLEQPDSSKNKEIQQSIHNLDARHTSIHYT